MMVSATTDSKDQIKPAVELNSNGLKYIEKCRKKYNIGQLLFYCIGPVL